MPLRAVIVDDEMLVRERMRTLVSSHAALELVGEAADGLAALDLIAGAEPHVVFLDVQMPELDGFQVVASMEGAIPAIVFVTAYDEYAIRAFEVDAIDYLLKPVTEARFAAAVERVLARRRDRDDGDDGIREMASRAADARAEPLTRFVVRIGQRHYFVRLAEVVWIEADGNYLKVFAGGRSHLVRATMKSVEPRLDPDAFVRVHRSAIVAVDRVETIEARDQGEYLIRMGSGARFTSSRGYSERVRRLLRG